MFKVWFQTTRPQSWIASIAPVFLASFFAADLELFSFLPAFFCLAFALLMQIATDLANDYYDFQRGTDGPDRVGPMRGLASGLIPIESMRMAIVILYMIALGFGLLLYSYVGPGVFLVMTACLIGGLLYTAGPFAFAYCGFSDIVTILFYGFIATVGTFYVQAGKFTPEVFLLGLALGLLTNNICLINHIRDAKTDAAANKNTLIVRFGKAFGCKLFKFETTVALIIPAVLATLSGNYFLLLPLTLAPWGLILYRKLRYYTNTGPSYTYLQAKACVLLFVYSLLLATGIALG